MYNQQNRPPVKTGLANLGTHQVHVSCCPYETPVMSVAERMNAWSFVVFGAFPTDLRKDPPRTSRCPINVRNLVEANIFMGDRRYRWSDRSPPNRFRACITRILRSRSRFRKRTGSPEATCFINMGI